MKITSKYTLERFTRHCKELESLGAEDGVKAYNRLVTLEKRAHKLAEDLCNFLDSEHSSVDKRSASIERAVAKVFGGILPVGFKFNYDPRGYALKIDTESNKVIRLPHFAGETVHYDRVISYTDFGDYGILAPEFGE